MAYDVFLRAQQQARQMQQHRTDQRLAAEQRDLRGRVGNALAGGDYGAASAEALRGGDVSTGLTIANVGRDVETSSRERQKSALAAAAAGLLQMPEANRAQVFQGVLAPRLRQEGVPEEWIGQVTPDLLTDAQLRGFVAAMGGEAPDAPSGYRFRADGSGLEAIPGGPADPANQRWQVTPYGLIPPAGWEPPAGHAPAAAPEYVDQLPPGVRPRPNQPPSARPAAGGGERAQPVSVSFRSPAEAQQAIAQSVPGVTFTSGRRSAADHARVRGARNSFHLQGRAWDLVPPPGMSMAQLAAKMRRQGFRVLNEGDHVHVSW